MQSCMVYKFWCFITDKKFFLNPNGTNLKYDQIAELCVDKIEQIRYQINSKEKFFHCIVVSESFMPLAMRNHGQILC